MSVADDRKYTKTHEWVKLDQGIAVTGISDHAQEALGDITFIETPEVDDEVTQGEECGVIESVKAASDLKSPLSGTVSEVNEDLEESPEKVNNSPYDEGWIFKIKDFSEDEYNSLMDASAYKEFLESGE